MRRGAVSIGLLGLATMVAPACDKSDSVVIVNVSAEAGVPSVFQLRALASNAGEGQTRMFPTAPGAQPIVFDTAFSLTVPRERSGAFDIALDGLDESGAIVANGAGSVDLRAGDNVTVTITLHAGPSLCGNRVIDDGEGCDDGDRLSKGDCDYVCQPRTPGPGTGGSGGAAGAGGTGTGGTGGRPCRVELLTSGDFDGDNSRWTQVTSGRPLIWDRDQTTPPFPGFVPAPHTPPRLAWLGYDVVPPNGNPAVRQSITIPADAVQVDISGYYRIETDETDCKCDFARVELDVGGNIMQLTEWSAENANTDWAYFATFVTGPTVAGRTVALQLRAQMDDGVNTSFYFDSLSVSANVCP